MPALDPLLEELAPRRLSRPMASASLRRRCCASRQCRAALVAAALLVAGLLSAVALRLADGRCGLELGRVGLVKGGVPEVWWVVAHWVGVRNLGLLVKWAPGYSGVYLAAESRGVPGEARIALTIDDAVGMNETGCASLLDLLQGLELNATFFVIADDRTVEDLSGTRQQILRRMALAGHEIGNHGLRDEEMIGMSRGKVEEEVREWERRVSSWVPGWPAQGRKWFRPPKGLLSPTMQGVLEQDGYRVALGDIFSDDWAFEDPAFHAGVIDHAAMDGSVIILHIPDRPDRQQTLEIVREVVPALRARGFRFVTLSELFETQPASSWRSFGSQPACAACVPCMALVGFAAMTLLLLAFATLVRWLLGILWFLWIGGPLCRRRLRLRSGEKADEEGGVQMGAPSFLALPPGPPPKVGL